MAAVARGLGQPSKPLPSSAHAIVEDLDVAFKAYRKLHNAKAAADSGTLLSLPGPDASSMEMVLACTHTDDLPSRTIQAAHGRISEELDVTMLRLKKRLQAHDKKMQALLLPTEPDLPAFMQPTGMGMGMGMGRVGGGGGGYRGGGMETGMGEMGMGEMGMGEMGMGMGMYPRGGAGAFAAGSEEEDGVGEGGVSEAMKDEQDWAVAQADLALTVAGAAMPHQRGAADVAAMQTAATTATAAALLQGHVAPPPLVSQLQPQPQPQPHGRVAAPYPDGLGSPLPMWADQRLAQRLRDPRRAALLRELQLVHQRWNHLAQVLQCEDADAARTQALRTALRAVVRSCTSFAVGVHAGGGERTT